MPSPWSLWFYSPLPHPVNARTQLWESMHLPTSKFYLNELRVDPQLAEYRLETLSPSYKSPLMDFHGMTAYLEAHRGTQTRYTIRVYPLAKKPAVNQKVTVNPKVSVDKEGTKTSKETKGNGEAKKEPKEEKVSTKNHSNTADVASEEVKDKTKPAASANKGKGKQQGDAMGTGSLKPNVSTGSKSDDATAAAPSPSLRMKGRQELSASASDIKCTTSAKSPNSFVWSDSEGDSDSDYEKFTLQSIPGLGDEAASLGGSTAKASSPVASVSVSAGCMSDETVPPPVPARCIIVNPPVVAERKPLFDHAQLQDLERIVTEATKAVPAGKEEDDLHQRLLSLLESIKPAPAPTSSVPTNGRMCAKPRQPIIDAQPEAAEDVQPEVKPEVNSSVQKPSEQPPTPEKSTSSEPPIANTAVYGLNPEDVLVSSCPTPTLSDSSANVDSPILCDRMAVFEGNLVDGILSPDSQKTLKGLYLADLLASPLNTPASSSVLRTLEEEDVGLDSSLGLKLLDLARSLRTDGDLSKSAAKKPETARQEKVDRTENMLLRVLEKLNDQAGMLNAIAEASGVNLLDDNEEEKEEEKADDEVTASVAMPTVSVPIISTETSTTSQGLSSSSAGQIEDTAAQVVAISESPADTRARLARAIATLEEMTQPATPATPTTAPAGAEVRPTAPPTPAAARLAAIAAALNDDASLFSPGKASTQPRPVPTVEDYSSETDDSGTSAPSDADTARARRDRTASRSASPQRSAPLRNPFADPPQFGRSYTPTRPGASGVPLEGNDRPSGRSAAEAFARYATNAQAFPSAAASAAARSAWAPAAAHAGDREAFRQAFYNNVDSYAGPPASLYDTSNPLRHHTRPLFGEPFHAQAGGGPFHLPYGNLHYNPFPPPHHPGMFGPVPPYSLFGQAAHSGGGPSDPSRHGFAGFGGAGWGQSRETRQSGSSASTSSFGDRNDEPIQRGPQSQGFFAPGQFGL